MIRQALEYIVGLNKPQIVDVGGIAYTDKDLCPVNYPLRETIKTHTLQSLINYIDTNDGDTFCPQYIHIKDSCNVALIGSADPLSGERHDIYATVSAMLPDIVFGRYMTMENFIIQLNTCFDRKQGQWKELLALASTMQIKDEVKVSDDGTSQEVTAKQGVARLAEVIIPNPVYLAPIRTFHEVEQVLVPFVYRVDKNGDMGLFEADGGAWRLEAINRIKEYFVKNLSDACAYITTLA